MYYKVTFKTFNGYIEPEKNTIVFYLENYSEAKKFANQLVGTVSPTYTDYELVIERVCNEQEVL